MPYLATLFMYCPAIFLYSNTHLRVQNSERVRAESNSVGRYQAGSPKPSREQFHRCVNQTNFSLAALKRTIFYFCIRLLGYLARKPHPPCFDDGQMYCVSETHTTHFFLRVLSLLQQAADSCEDSSSVVVVDES